MKTLRAWECLDSDIHLRCVTARQAGEDLADPSAFHFGAARAVRKYHLPDFSHWKNHDASAFARLEKDLRTSLGK